MDLILSVQIFNNHMISRKKTIILDLHGGKWHKDVLWRKFIKVLIKTLFKTFWFEMTMLLLHCHFHCFYFSDSVNLERICLFHIVLAAVGKYKKPLSISPDMDYSKRRPLESVILVACLVRRAFRFFQF